MDNNPYRIGMDFRNPLDWYPTTRARQRKWVIHAGPTNSGKTYGALERLKSAKSGIYVAPLRMLAREVYDRFKALGIPCNLLTGDEIITDFDENGFEAPHTAATAEMASKSSKKVEVAVVDEIQFLDHPDRGPAWTACILGLEADELYLCGEERTVQILKRLAKKMGDKVEVKYFNRLSELIVEDVPITSWSQLKPGDCIVSLSRRGIFDIKARIEGTTSYKCAVIYGGLPAASRREQSLLFNNPDSGYDIMIASNAIGLGLNLAIKRIIFANLWFFDGVKRDQLDPPTVRQIAGRAGRYKVAYVNQSQNNNKNSNNNKLESSSSDKGDLREKKNVKQKIEPGYVTAFGCENLEYVKKCLTSAILPITSAYMNYPEHFYRNLITSFPPNVSPSSIEHAMKSLMELPDAFKWGSNTDNYLPAVTQALSKFAFALTVFDKVRFRNAPFSRHHSSIGLIFDMAGKIARGVPFNLTDIPSIDLKLLYTHRPPTTKLLFDLELLHSQLILVKWYSIRYPHILNVHEVLHELTILCEAKLTSVLKFNTLVAKQAYNDKHRM